MNGLSKETLLALSSLRECLFPAEIRHYTEDEMTDIFSAYHDHLLNCDLDQKTQERYWQIVTSYVFWLDGRPPDANNAQEFLAHLRSKGYRPRSVLLYYHALRLFLDFLGIQFRVKLRKARELPPYHDQGDIEALIAQASIGLHGQQQWHRDRNKALVLTFAYTGIRRQELLDLLVADIDFERRLLFVRNGKGNKDRTIPLAERLVIPLRIQCAGKGARQKVFHGLNARSVYRIITGLARACGLEGFHPHSLRHFFATRLIDLGVSLRTVQELLGHADISTTAIYIDVSAHHLRDAIEKLDCASDRSTEHQRESRPPV